MFESYDDAVQFLYTNLPMFQRIGAAALKHDLSNTIRLCEALGNPQLKFKSIHIAGTNGKGSSSHMIASVLQEAGFRTGLYTSPHLKDFTERIRLDGTPVSRSSVLDFVNRIRTHIELIQPSFFEITVAMAFDYFAHAGVDVAVIETGLGGRLDSTNVITPVVSLITNIGWDHKDILGDTLEKIAWEKAGIIKPGIPVVISERQANIEHVFLQRARDLKSPISFATDSYEIDQLSNNGVNTLRVVKGEELIFESLELPLQGNYQRKNVAGVLAVIDTLRLNGFSISNEQVVKGLAGVVVNTNLKGRWQVLSRRPLLVCDTGHNIDGIREVVGQIHGQQYERLYMIIGMVKDKDITSILVELPREATYYFCEAKIPRALPAEQLKVASERAGLYGEVITDVNDAIKKALSVAGENDLIFVGGSTFTVAEIDNL
ncbi:folylpolyglutamate synthase/dihydrofolate synthase family protein [Chryseolinea sp. T2]|uniref:bifunctional folylpolyglutamate synthase/dihydrofolate synthase n=1 Tax=Chryseolinea sp. T2 TaxID=3129255 RepID=UPI003077EC74